MKKFLMLFLIILSGCVTDRNFNQSNLCDIFQTNPQWKSYAEKTKDAARHAKFDKKFGCRG